MTSITSKAKFRQRVIRYSEKYGVTAASIRHRVTRKTINPNTSPIAVICSDLSLYVKRQQKRCRLRSSRKGKK